MRNHTLVIYDIRDAHRLRAVHSIVRDFGDSIQYSVFTCQLSRKDRAELEARLLEEIHQSEDQVMFVDLGRVRRDDDLAEGPPRCTYLGVPGIPESGPRLIVI